MQKLLDTLSRLGPELGSMLGSDTMDILDLMDSSSSSNFKKAEVLISRSGPEGILLDKNNRRAVLEALSESDVRDLAEKLGVRGPSDPWAAVVRTSFTRTSPRTAVLFEYFECKPPVLDLDKELPPNTRSIKPGYSLFEHQIQACRKVIEFLKEKHRPRVLLHMPTGAGKTRSAMNIITHFMRDYYDSEDLVVWLAHSEELCEQAAQEFEKAWELLGIRGTTVHRLFGPHQKPLSEITGGFLVAGLGMLDSRRERDDEGFYHLGSKAKLVVMDEAHQAIAPTYQHLLDMLALNPKTGVLGLSATPGRDSLDAHKDLELAQFFKRNKVTLEVEGYESPVEYLQAQGYLAKVNYERLNYSPGDNFSLSEKDKQKLASGFDLSSAMLKRIGADVKRNLLILKEIKELAEGSKNKIIVFACSVQHAELLANVLTILGLKAASITSKTQDAHRRNLIDEYKNGDSIQILTNYGVLTTGFDAPRTNVAVIARPTSSVVLYSQMIGRAARGIQAGGNIECKVVTIVDELPGFRSIAEAFEYWDEIWD